MSEAIHYSSDKPLRCPSCGADSIAEIKYGNVHPDDDLREQMRRGEVVLGGSIIRKNQPAWRCNQCRVFLYISPELENEGMTDYQSPDMAYVEVASKVLRLLRQHDGARSIYFNPKQRQSILLILESLEIRKPFFKSVSSHIRQSLLATDTPLTSMFSQTALLGKNRGREKEEIYPIWHTSGKFLGTSLILRNVLAFDFRGSDDCLFIIDVGAFENDLSDLLEPREFVNDFWDESP